MVNLHTGASGSATDARAALRRAPTGVPRPLRGVRVHPSPPVVHDPRRRLRPSPGPGRWWSRRTGCSGCLPGAGPGSFFDTHGGAPVRSYLSMRPSEYVDRHVFLGGSLMQRLGAERREEIGVDRMMWGADYPHLEGAAPVHRLVLRQVFGGLPEPDLRRILGGNACRPVRLRRGAAPGRSPTGSGPPWPTCPRPSAGTTSRRRSVGDWPALCRWPRPRSPAPERRVRDATRRECRRDRPPRRPAADDGRGLPR